MRFPFCLPVYVPPIIIRGLCEQRPVLFNAWRLANTQETERSNGGVTQEVYYEKQKTSPELLVSPLSVPTRPSAANMCRLTLPRGAHDTAGVLLSQNRSAAFPTLGITACHGLGSKITSHTARDLGGAFQRPSPSSFVSCFHHFVGPMLPAFWQPGLLEGFLENSGAGESGGASRGNGWGSDSGTGCGDREGRGGETTPEGRLILSRAHHDCSKRLSLLCGSLPRG